jgi:hypothetical protein
LGCCRCACIIRVSEKRWLKPVSDKCQSTMIRRMAVIRPGRFQKPARSAPVNGID